MTALRLESPQLYTRTDETSLDFATTADLSPLDALIGQERAQEAMALALAMADAGYNTFVMGDTGLGKHTFARRVLEQHAAQQPTPEDLCYVHGFANPMCPRALRLPPARGRVLRADMKALIESLRMAVRSAFDSDDYRGRRHVLEHEVEQRHEQVLEQLQKEAREKSLAFLRTPMGFAFAPTLGGEILSPEVFGKLAADEQERVKQNISEMEQKLAFALAQVPRLQREAHERIRTLDREVTDFAVRPLFEDLTSRYTDLPTVSEWLAEVRKDVGDRAQVFLAEEAERESNPMALALMEVRPERWAELRYSVNLLVDRAEAHGAPVVYEDHPTLENLMGRIEYRAQLGNLVTDFTLIQPGALHRANGGHLILDAQKLLSQPQAYEALKRALRSGQARIESVAESLGMSPPSRLNPEPMVLAVKVTLLGDRSLYYLLSAYDPDFDQLFKVAADFSEDLPRDRESERSLARMVAGMLTREKLRPLDKSAVARVIEHSARLADDAFRLSLRTQSLIDLLREADYFAQRSQRNVVTREDVGDAIRAQARRADRVREDSLRLLKEGTLLVSTRGQAVGQVNGLSVLALGNFAFGRPSRITCRVRMGRGEVLDIEREVRLGGPLHSKGVLILAGFLGQRYAKEQPLSLSASLVFEQSYGGVDGDSASLAELCTLLSAIAEVPIAQRFALTGSVNQMGDVQPIGGVNEKVEGYFDACVAQGLTGEQAVIIPASNVRHLMLRADVVKAVEAGTFAIFAVTHVDDALGLLTDCEVGAPNAEGAYPDGSLNARVEARLKRLSERVKELSPAGFETRVATHPPSKAPEPSVPGPAKDHGNAP